MESVAKNLAICGTVIVAILVAWSYLRIQHSQETLRNLENQAVEIARSDASSRAISGDYVLLASTGGWGINSVPAMSLDRFKRCFDTKVPVHVYYKGSDLEQPKSLESKLYALETMPESTFVYAQEFNSVMIQELTSRNVVNCI